MKRKLNKAIEEYLNLLRRKYSDAIQSVVLFGSAARGEMQNESDADVLIVVSGGNARTRDAISRGDRLSAHKKANTYKFFK